MIVLGELQHMLLQLHLNMVAKRSRTVVVWRIDYGWYAQPQGIDRRVCICIRTCFDVRAGASGWWYDDGFARCSCLWLESHWCA